MPLPGSLLVAERGPFTCPYTFGARMALTDVGYVMDVLQVRNRAADVVARYDLLRASMEAAIKKWVKWGLEQVVGSVEYYDGQDYRDLVLRTPWVTTVTSVYLDALGAYGQAANSFATATLLTAGVDYALIVDNAIGKSGLLRRLAGTSLYWFPSDLLFARQSGGLATRKGPTWPAGSGNVKVTCTYGYATVPDDLKGAVAEACGVFSRSVKYGWPTTSESLSDYSYSLAIARDPEFASIRGLLTPYRDLII